MQIDTHNRTMSIVVGPMTVELTSYNFGSGPVLHVGFPSSATLTIRGHKGDKKPPHAGHIIISGDPKKD